METAIAIRETEVLDAGLAKLRSEADAIVVGNQQQYVEAANIALAARKYIKDVGFKLDPGIDSAKDHLNTLKNQKLAYTEPAKEIDRIASAKGAEWKRLEREAAEKEEAKINQQRITEARESHTKIPDAVRVEAAVPKVAGIRARTQYFAEVANEEALIQAFVKGDKVEREFLRQFITVDPQAVGRYAREQKDNKAVEKVLPGVRAWSEDRI